MNLYRAWQTASRIYRHEGAGALLRAIYNDLNPFDKAFRPNEARIVFELLGGSKVAGTMVDVGAHTGGSLRRFLEHGWNVIAFEPDTHNRRFLLERFGTMPNLKVDVRALDEKPGENAALYRSSQSSGISGLNSFHASHHDAERVTVTTLAEALPQISSEIDVIDFLKIDTEGLDLCVLRGLDWSKQVPRVVLCEFEDSKSQIRGYAYQDLCQFLLDKGYQLVICEWQPITHYGRQHDFTGFYMFPHQLTKPLAWGNVIAVSEPSLYPRLCEICASLHPASHRHLATGAHL
ncbi:MAG: FkbM family methyltransferase [Gammaproteobacteria bacterium]